MCCREETIEAWPARYQEGGCIVCDSGYDVMCIRLGNMLIRLCLIHRREVGSLR